MPGTLHRQPSETAKKEYMDFSNDHVARVRAAKEAAQQEMESFGDPSEYDVVILQGQLKEDPPSAPSQSFLGFETDASHKPEEAD